MASNIKLVNNLPQRLPILLTNTTTRSLEQSYIPARGSKIIRNDELSDHLNGLIRQGKVKVINL